MTRTRASWGRAAVVALVLLVAVTGCGPRPSTSSGSIPASTPASTPTSTSATTPEPVGSPFPAAAKINTFLTGLAQRGQLSGTVLLARDGYRFVRAYGLADRATGAPNTAGTMFRIGSVTKQFTAMAVLLLQQQHRLDVTDRVCSYLDDCPPSWASITIGQLLTHSSGIPDYLNELGLGWPPLAATPAELVAEFRDAPLNFAPGTRMRYSNSGYALLGYLIERLTADTYAHFLQHHIFDPLAMRHTGFDTTEVRPGHAVGYYANGQPPTPYPMSAAYSAGALYSTAADMQRWDDALQHNTLLPPAAMQQMFAVHIPCPPPASPGGCLLPTDLGYGYGWFVAHEPQGTLEHHVGHIDGYFSFNGIYPASHLHIIVLSNSETTDTLTIARTLAAIVHRG
ncbi:serine hydrolase domain-containing protein [Lapillicoccus sp.]|uniref:serine hydrolase domain-containing protein n=1 Tax=Lapillicoccus sp. TaxID=1909287 RepID=UPI0025D3C126|nr:serine hydrolase domain-containing protein [Lapillicoccus sp.]